MGTSWFQMKKYMLENGLSLERPRELGISPLKGLLTREGDHGKTKYHPPKEHLEPQILKIISKRGTQSATEWEWGHLWPPAGSKAHVRNPPLPVQFFPLSVSHPRRARFQLEKKEGEKRRRKRNEKADHPLSSKSLEPETDLTWYDKFCIYVSFPWTIHLTNIYYVSLESRGCVLFMALSQDPTLYLTGAQKMFFKDFMYLFTCLFIYLF